MDRIGIIGEGNGGCRPDSSEVVTALDIDVSNDVPEAGGAPTLGHPAA